MFQIAHKTPSIKDLGFPVSDFKERLESESTERLCRLMCNEFPIGLMASGSFQSYAPNIAGKLDRFQKATGHPHIEGQNRQELWCISEPFLTAGIMTPDSVIRFLKKMGTEIGNAMPLATKNCAPANCAQVQLGKSM